MGLADIGDKVVVGAAIIDGVFPLAALAHAKARSGKEHGYVYALGIHVAHARWQIIVFEPAQTAAHQAVLAIGGQKRAAALAVGLRQIVSHVALFFDDVTVGIDNVHSLVPPQRFFSPRNCA